MHRKKKFWIGPAILTPIVFMGTAIFYILWIVVLPHTYDPGDKTTSNDVKYYTSVSPPPEAHHWQVASFEQGQARQVFVRFEAPVDVCLHFAADVVKSKQSLIPVTSDQQYSDCMAIFMNCKCLSDLRWYDLAYAHHLWTGSGENLAFRKPDYDTIPQAANILGVDENTEKEGYLTTAVRVDVSRGIFYFWREN